MTNITELAQSLKRRAASANEFGEGLFFIKADDVLALVEALEKAQQRIAELGSRTVKMPDLRQIVSGDRYVWSDGVYNYSQDVKVALAAAGIKVEAE